MGIMHIIWTLVVGLIVGVPALRLQGIYLALATLALHFIILFAAETFNKFRYSEVMILCSNMF